MSKIRPNYWEIATTRYINRNSLEKNVQISSDLVYHLIKHHEKVVQIYERT